MDFNPFSSVSRMFSLISEMFRTGELYQSFGISQSRGKGKGSAYSGSVGSAMRVAEKKRNQKMHKRHCR